MILQSPFVLALIYYSLRRNGYQYTLDQLTSPPGLETLPEKQLATSKEVAYALSVAIKAGPWRPKCLLRSLSLGWLLKRRGMPFLIRIGIPNRKITTSENESIDFSAHAWVEHAGVVLNDRQDVAEQFSAFDTGPGPV